MTLRGTDLRGANLVNALHADADLRGADLRGARFENARLDGADLRTARIDASTDLARADARGCIGCPERAGTKP